MVRIKLSSNVDRIGAELARLMKFGLSFTTERTQAESVTSAIFDDTCGKLIPFYQL